MDLEDFKQRLMSEPRSDHPEMVAARGESTEHRAAFNEAEAFELTLDRALAGPADPNRHERILAHSLGQPRPAAMRWLAMAAMLVVAAGMGLLGWWHDQRSLPVRTAFVEHFYHPEPAALASTDAVAFERLQEAFAEHGEQLIGLSDAVTYLSRCPIGGRRGLHLVAREDGQQITVMYLPEATLEASEEFRLDETSARLVATRTGVLAFFGHQGQDVVEASERWLTSLEPRAVVAGL